MRRRKRSFRREAAQIAEQSSARAKRSARKGPRASGNACADTLRTARAGWAALTTGPERIPRRDAQDAARRRCRAQGGVPTKPCKAHSRMDCASRRKAESAVAEWRAARAANAPVPTARRIDPDSRAAFAQSDGGARRTHPKAILRLSSGADGRGGTLCARGSTVGAKRCARCGGRAKALHAAADSASGKKSPRLPRPPENLFSPDSIGSGECLG